jgi:biopolymer transport protein ExbD
MVSSNRKLIHLGPSTLLPTAFVSAFLLVLSFFTVPAFGGPYLPNAATGLPVGPNPLTVGINNDGKFYLLESSGWIPVVDAELPARVKAHVASKPGVTRLYVTADRHAPYARLLVLAEAARGAGVQQLDLATECPRGKEFLVRACHPSKWRRERQTPAARRRGGSFLGAFRPAVEPGGARAATWGCPYMVWGEKGAGPGTERAGRHAGRPLRDPCDTQCVSPPHPPCAPAGGGGGRGRAGSFRSSPSPLSR